jgi:GDP-L-fucose synthase
LAASNEFWSGKRVLVTGGTGFIGSHVVEQLLTLGARVRVPVHTPERAERFLGPRLSEIETMTADLRDPGAAERVVRNQEIVMHLAAVVGGIEYNIAHPASIFRDNTLVFIGTLDAARRAGVERFLVTSSACVYPRHCTIPTPESEGFRDRPEPTNEGYGWAKRMQEFLGESYAREYGMKVAIARPYNCYGPRDNFSKESSHVIPALIRRIWTDREDPLAVWGSGTQSRSFLYVEDFARGLIEVTEKHPQAEALNVGADEETTIAELVETLSVIHEETRGKRIQYRFDTSKPEGQPRRRCDTRLVEERVGFRARWDLASGLRATVKWYLENGPRD